MTRIGEVTLAPDSICQPCVCSDTYEGMSSAGSCIVRSPRQRGYAGLLVPSTALTPAEPALTGGAKQSWTSPPPQTLGELSKQSSLNMLFRFPMPRSDRIDRTELRGLTSDRAARQSLHPCGAT